VLYIPVIIVGHFLITFDLLPALTLPPIHILAAALPPLAVLVFVGRALKSANLRWREIVVQLSGGAFLATSIALIAEVGLGLTILFLSLFVTALAPGGLGRVEEFAAHLQDPFWLQNPDNLQQLFFFPPVLVTLLAVFVLLGPIIEEIGKLLGVTLMSYRRPSSAQAFLWGLASGAGFTLIENLFNTTLALEGWIVIMILRVGATAMHCLAGGLTALGWQRLLVERRPWKLMGAYILSVTIHAIWNALVIAIAGIGATAFASSAELTQILSGGAILLLAALFLGLALAIVVTLVVITYRLRSQLADSKTNDP
jgi:RsiW-degrading membrane proteinase PrsW (M82 family)